MVAMVSGLALLLYQQWGKTSPDNWEMVASIPSDSITQYTLADQSTIILNRNSKLAYASDFGKADRRVKLSGEAFFKVQPDTAKPFIVETGETYIRVTGTSFNIKGEEADSLVEVYVKTGSVLFFTANNEGVSLLAGEVGVYNKIRNTFTKTVAVDPNATAYASRVFVFYNTTLNEVFRQLGKVYNVSIILEKPQIGLCTITVSFDDDEIGTILSVIAETLDLKLTVDQQTFRFDGEGCTNGANTP
jgi:ferric-dicitrate binding protein FerR (iron transport regulator)